MNWTTAGEIARFAKQQPALAAVAAIGVIAGYLVWAHFGHGLARGEDLTALETKFITLNTEVAGLKDGVKDGRLEGLEGQLFEARVSQCRAETPELKEVYAERVTKLLTDYRDAGGGDLSLPRCDDL